jgi:NADPH:quinone reductase-like Zn-dependent oxidoreductase
MHALYIGNDQQVVLRELPTPLPGPGEVLIRLSLAGACGVCDLH